MATQAHCAYCFESLTARLEKRSSLSLEEVEALWAKYNAEPTAAEPNHSTEDDAPAGTSPSYKPAAISRLLAPSPSSSNSSTPQSGVSTPGAASEASSATSQNSSRSNLFFKDTPEKHPLFVTWNTITKHSEKRLRGCIGTFEAQPLDKGLRSYALTSAFDDTRFPPVAARELPSLSCAVTLLTDFEPAADHLDWELGTHGLRLSFMYHGRKHGATYLPDVAREQEWTKEETLISLMRKAGWNGRKEDWEKVDLAVVRYQGKKVALEYEEWKEWRDWVDEEMVDA